MRSSASRGRRAPCSLPTTGMLFSAWQATTQARAADAGVEVDRHAPLVVGLDPVVGREVVVVERQVPGGLVAVLPGVGEVGVLHEVVAGSRPGRARASSPRPPGASSRRCGASGSRPGDADPPVVATRGRRAEPRAESAAEPKALNPHAGATRPASWNAAVAGV